MYFQYFFNNLHKIYIYPVLFNISYYSVHLFVWVKSLIPSKKPQYILQNIYLCKNVNEYIIYDINNFYEKPSNFNFIKIEYTYNNKPFKMLINSCKIGSIYNYYPPYKQNNNLNLTSKLQKILSANLITDNKSIDITKELNEYAGPMNNFYTDILEDNEICPVKYAFSNVNKIDIIDDCANSIELNDKLKL